MFGAAIIIFRESLEAALILGVVAAATRGVQDRNRAISMGVLVGVLGSFFLAALMGKIANLADGLGQELFNAVVLFTAVLMLAWHHIWMQSHGAELAAKAKSVGLAVSEGTVGLSAITLLIALTVLREGGESVLFLQGILSGSEVSLLATLLGALLGLVAGAALGTVLYFGLVKVPLRWFFSVTGVLLVLLASGLAGQAAKFLVQADYLPSLVFPVWDLSGVLSKDSLLGSILHVLIGYDPTPSGMQVLFYSATFATITIAAWVVKMKLNAEKNSGFNKKSTRPQIV